MTEAAQDDALTLARAKRILPLLPALSLATDALADNRDPKVMGLLDLVNTIFDADQDAMGAFEESQR